MAKVHVVTGLGRSGTGDDVQGNLANVDFDELPDNPDGSFEIFLGPNPPAKPDGNYWVKLDPSIRNVMLTDYSYHQSSINGAQARLDSDGKFRAVLALADPSVPNWLAPADSLTGMALLRFYKSADFVTPTVTKVKLADVRRHLPPDTPVVTAEQRRIELETRRTASLRRYGQ